MGKLIVTRALQPLGSFRLFRIVIDGQRLASITNGQSTVLELPAGRHKVVARVDWHGSSKPLAIDVAPQGSTHVKVGTAVGWWHWLWITAWFALFYWQNVVLLLLFVGLSLAPVTPLRNRFLYIRTITAAEAAALRGRSVPHPDALPSIRLTYDLFTKR
jgi:hypothetical protein